MPKDNRRGSIARAFKHRVVKQIVLMMLVGGMLILLLPAPAAVAAQRESKSSTSDDSAGARTLEKLKDKDDVAASTGSGPTPSIAPPGDPEQILPPGPTLPDWQAGKELVGKRTATSKAFTGRSPGEIETRLYAEPIHYRQGDSWVAIDSGLESSGDGKRKNRANDFGLELAESADDPSLAELVLDSTHSVSFGLDKAAKVKGKVAKNSVTYSKVRKDTDLRLTSTNVGVKEELILASPDAPSRFLFPLKLKGLTASIDELGDVVYSDAQGKQRARTPHGYMFDSNLDPLSDEPAMSTGVTYALISHGKGTALEVTLDSEWLDSKDRVWPITVDPEINRGTWGDDTFVMNPYVNDYSSSTELKVGSFNGGANKARSFMHFDTGSLPGTVTYAELQMREMHSYNCGAPPEAIFRVTQGWAGSTMRSFPGAGYDPSGTLGWWVNGACPSRLAAWNVTGMVQQFQNIGETSGSFAAVATQETNSNQWKKYRSSQAGDGPLLKVFTNYPPVTPWAVTPTNNQRVFTASVPVSAAYADADGTPGYIALGVWDTTGTMVWAQWSGLQTNYTIANATTSALADGWYRISTIAWDGQLYSEAWSPDQWFYVDTQRPAVSWLSPAANSTVGSPVTVSARYTEPHNFEGQILFAANRPDGTGAASAWSGNVCSGCTATLTMPALAPGPYDFYAIGNDGGGDVNAYGTAWSGPYRMTVAGAPGAPTNLSTSAGPTSALVKWTDGANNNSPITEYDFTAYNSTNPEAAPVQRSCLTGCSPVNGFLVDGLTPGNSYTIKATATNAYGTSPLSAASPAVTPQDWSGYSVTATAPARGDTSAWL
ncbi:hypothetical protein BH23ACT12_BH23ACT12_14430 [soil metagenome]